jgi:hypothetical protein
MKLSGYLGAVVERLWSNSKFYTTTFDGDIHQRIYIFNSFLFKRACEVAAYDRAFSFKPLLFKRRYGTVSSKTQKNSFFSRFFRVIELAVLFSA